MIWYEMRWDDTIWYDMIWYDMIRYDTIRYDMIWYDMMMRLRWWWWWWWWWSWYPWFWFLMDDGIFLGNQMILYDCRRLWYQILTNITVMIRRWPITMIITITTIINVMMNMEGSSMVWNLDITPNCRLWKLDGLIFRIKCLGPWVPHFWKPGFDRVVLIGSKSQGFITLTSPSCNGEETV